MGIDGTKVHPHQVSVVMPTFNDERYIIEALDSILGQTARPGEIIVVDDASSDTTPRLLADYIERHAHLVPIRSIRLPARSGSERARNVGVGESNGTWIASCDADDRWAPVKLERQLDYIERWTGRDALVVLGTQGFNMNAAGRVISPLSLGLTTETEFRSRQLHNGLCWLAHCSVIFEKAAFLTAGGYRLDYLGAEDLDLWSRMAELGVVINIDDALVYYRKRPGSMQHSLFWEQQDNLLRISENIRRRAAGAQEFTLEQFRATLRSAPRSQRVRQWRLRWGKYYYRTGSTNVVNSKRVQGAGQLALGAVLDPGRAFSGARGVVAHRLPLRSPRRRRAMAEPQPTEP